MNIHEKIIKCSTLCQMDMEANSNPCEAGFYGEMAHLCNVCAWTFLKNQLHATYICHVKRIILCHEKWEILLLIYKCSWRYTRPWSLRQCLFPKILLLTLALLNQDRHCLWKQCSTRSDGFWRSHLIRIYTVFHSVCEFIWSNNIELSDW